MNTAATRLCLVFLIGLAAGAFGDPGGEERGELLLSVRGRLGYSVVLFDPATKKSRTLVPAGKETQFTVVAVSSRGKTLVLAERSSAEFGRVRRYTWRAVGAPSKVLGELSSQHLAPVFSDEEHLLALGKAQDTGPGEYLAVIKQIDVASGEDVDLSVVEGLVFPKENGGRLELSPNLRRLAYTTLQSRKGPLQLHVLELGSGKTTTVSKERVAFVWAEDSLHGFLTGPKERLDLVKAAPGKALQRQRGISTQVAARPILLGQDALLLVRYSLKSGKVSLRGVHIDLGSGVETLLTKELSALDEGGPFAQLGSSGQFAFVEPKKGGGSRLIRARVQAGKVVERECLLDSDQTIMGSILSLRRDRDEAAQPGRK